MRTLVSLVALLCGACENETEAPFLETKYVRYETDQPFTPCGGLARDTDRKIEHLYDRLGEPYPPPQTIYYDWVADQASLTCGDNAGGCTYQGSEGVSIGSLELAHFHELAHAAQILSFGSSRPLLREGFASYYANYYGDLSADGVTKFATIIESIFTEERLPKGDEYGIAAKFVGATIERYGFDAFEDFWKAAAPTRTLAEFSATYEAHYNESWSDALAKMASWKQQVYFDLECEGDAQVVGAGEVQLVVTETCEDENVYGPVVNGVGHAGEVRIPVELSADGAYRFTVDHPGGEGEGAALFRGCQAGGPAPVSPITAFWPGDDEVFLIAAGRYLLSVRVPLTPGERPVKVTISPEG